MQGVEIDDRAPCGVDQHRAGFHSGKGVGPEGATVLKPARHVQADDVSAGQQLFEAEQLDALFGGGSGSRQPDADDPLSQLESLFGDSKKDA